MAGDAVPGGCGVAAAAARAAGLAACAVAGFCAAKVRRGARAWGGASPRACGSCWRLGPLEQLIHSPSPTPAARPPVARPRFFPGLARRRGALARKGREDAGPRGAACGPRHAACRAAGAEERAAGAGRGARAASGLGRPKLGVAHAPRPQCQHDRTAAPLPAYPFFQRPDRPACSPNPPRQALAAERREQEARCEALAAQALALERDRADVAEGRGRLDADEQVGRVGRAGRDGCRAGRPRGALPLGARLQATRL
jgi:hypothetical protein